jgi:hypothetical protein
MVSPMERGDGEVAMTGSGGAFWTTVVDGGRRATVVSDGCGGVRRGGVGGGAPSGFQRGGTLRSPVTHKRHKEGREGACVVVRAEKGEGQEKEVDDDSGGPFYSDTVGGGRGGGQAVRGATRRQGVGVGDRWQ